VNLRTRLWVLASIALGACGGGSYAAESAPSPAYDSIATGGGSGGDEVYAVSAEADSDDGSSYEIAEEGGAVDDRMRAEPGSVTAPMQPQEQYAQNQPNNGQPQEATDAVEAGGPLLIYTGDFTLGVYAVGETQERIIEAIRQLGGHVSQRNDAMLVVRVPAARFEAAIESIEQAGDVLGRNVQATDVSEEFRDLEIRIRNAEAMRDRLEQLLGRANDVTAALAIERELQRLTEYIETMKGRQRFLADRISLSTITIRFQALGTEGSGRDGFTLPFPWLDEIGLSNLMRLQ
jgi:hypothetical protein